MVTAKVKGKTLKCKVTVTKKQAAKKNAKTAGKRTQLQIFLFKRR